MAAETEVRRIKAAERLGVLMKSCGIRPAELSRMLGINRSTVSRYLSGEYIPSDENAGKLAALLHTSIDWIQGRECTGPFDVLASNYVKLNEEGQGKVVEYSESLRRSGRFEPDPGKGAGNA